MQVQGCLRQISGTRTGEAEGMGPFCHGQKQCLSWRAIRRTWWTCSNRSWPTWPVIRRFGPRCDAICPGLSTIPSSARSSGRFCGKCWWTIRDCAKRLSAMAQCRSTASDAVDCGASGTECASYRRSAFWQSGGRHYAGVCACPRNQILAKDRRWFLIEAPSPGTLKQQTADAPVVLRVRTGGQSDVHPFVIDR